MTEDEMQKAPLFTPEQITIATGAALVFPGSLPDTGLSGVSIDSRAIQPGELFIAIRGQRFDGHDFVVEAFARGAAGAIIEQRWYQIPNEKWRQVPPVWGVPDSLKAFGDLAGFHRRRFRVPLVAITGSCGKTTTKAMLHQILGEGNALATVGTQNNLVGVPLTLLRMHPRHRAAVLELGTNRWGEIRRLTEITQPTVGAITNIGPAHLETFGDLKGVLRAKAELWEAMDPKNTLVFNADDPLLWEAGHRIRHRVIWFGTNPKADLRAAKIQLEPWGSRCWVNDSVEMRLPIPGRHNLMNALAAAACAHALGVDLSDAARRLESVSPLAGRGAPVRMDGSLFIDDSYNANPASLKAALEVLQGIDRPGQWLRLKDAEPRPPGRRILVMGDMLELGEQAEPLHRQAGRWVAESQIDFLMAVGPLAKLLLTSAQEAGFPLEAGKAFDSSEEAGQFLIGILRPGDTVLLKGSRGMKMERALPERCFTTSSPH